MEEINYSPKTSENAGTGRRRSSKVKPLGDEVDVPIVNMVTEGSESRAMKTEQEPKPERTPPTDNDRAFTRALNRVCVSDQIGRQESIMKSSFLSSVASMGSAINVWSKYSGDDATKDKPELTILIVLLIVKTLVSYQLLLVQLYDIGRLKMYALLSVSQRKESQSKNTGFFCLMSFHHLMFDIYLEAAQIYLMTKLQSDFKTEI
jgi:hypothetical protein